MTNQESLQRELAEDARREALAEEAYRERQHVRRELDRTDDGQFKPWDERAHCPHCGHNLLCTCPHCSRPAQSVYGG